MSSTSILRILMSIAWVTLTACASKDWPAYRYRAARTADQPHKSVLSDPARVSTLHQVWEFKPSDVGDVDADGFAASPTVYDGKVFVGHRNGRFYAVNANTGTMIWRYPQPPQPLLLQNFIGNPSSPGIASSATIAKVGRTHIGTFNFAASDPPRGGGIWSSPAARGDAVFVTTGNGCTPGDGGCLTEPANNHALSMLKLNGSTGAVLWKVQPVPWSMDDDPDWAGTPVVAETRCGALSVGTMKDGYTHAVHASSGAVAWSFPFVTGGLPFTYGDHSDWGWTRPAASWKDVIVAITGGFPITTSGPTRWDGYDRLYALNACAPYRPDDHGRVRWIADIPGLDYTGQPTVTRAQSGQQASQGRPYESLAPGVTTRVRFATDFSFSGGPALEIKVYDWIIAPRQEISNFPMEGFATIEVNAGTIESTIGGQTVRHHQGEHWVVPDGARLAIRVPSDTGRGDNLVSLHAVVAIRK